MSPNLVLYTYLFLLFILFILDYQWLDNRSSHINILPLIWVFIISTRFLSQWLDFKPAPRDLQNSAGVSEGSPLDRNFFLIMIVLGVIVLIYRKIPITNLIQDNWWIIVFLAYGAISIIWSDYPFVSFKRWFKYIGNFVMVLILLTDTYPKEAIKTLFRRMIYIVVPLSVIFIKYFPELGRSYSQFTGIPFYTGVTSNKNELGVLCLICGIFIIWRFLTKNKKSILNNDIEGYIYIIMFFMIIWLFDKADSATSLLCFILGTLILIITKFELIRININMISIFVVVLVAVFFLLEISIDLTSLITLGLGRDITFTGRTEIWSKVIELVNNPITGTGFESFWLGERSVLMGEEYFWKPNQAHNGYIETYINLGVIGIFLLITMIIHAFKNIQFDLNTDYDYGRFKLTIFVIVVIYNITEASFHGLNLILILFILIAIKRNMIFLLRPGPIGKNSVIT